MDWKTLKASFFQPKKRCRAKFIDLFLLLKTLSVDKFRLFLGQFLLLGLAVYPWKNCTGWWIRLWETKKDFRKCHEICEIEKKTKKNKTQCGQTGAKGLSLEALKNFAKKTLFEKYAIFGETVLFLTVACLNWALTSLYLVTKRTWFELTFVTFLIVF